jgi:hypothetical protein
MGSCSDNLPPPWLRSPIVVCTCDARKSVDGAPGANPPGAVLARSSSIPGTAGLREKALRVKSLRVKARTRTEFLQTVGSSADQLGVEWPNRNFQLPDDVGRGFTKPRDLVRIFFDSANLEADFSDLLFARTPLLAHPLEILPIEMFWVDKFPVDKLRPKVMVYVLWFTLAHETQTGASPVCKKSRLAWLRYATAPGVCSPGKMSFSAT